MSYFLRYSFVVIIITSVSFITSGNDKKADLYKLHEESVRDAMAPGDTILGTITGTPTSVCFNAPKPVITLTGKDGTAPYTFEVNMYNEKDTIIKTANSSNKSTINAPTNKAGSFIYTLKV